MFPSREQLLQELAILDQMISRGKEWVENNPFARDIQQRREKLAELVDWRRDLEVEIAKLDGQPK